MDGKIKVRQITDLLARVLVPLTAYVFAGLAAVELFDMDVDSICYVAWGFMAAVVLAISREIRKHIADKIVNVGLGVYIAVIVTWFYRYQEGGYRIQAAYATVGLCTMFLLWKLYDCRITRMLLGCAALAALICLEFAGIHFSRGIIALAVFLFLYSVSETVSHINSFIMIYGVIALAVMFTPAPEEPYDWGFVVRAAQAVSRMAETISIELQYQWGKRGWDGVFHYGYAGYSGQAVSLSMGLSDRDIVQMTLWGGKTSRNLYLKGNVCDAFTGRGWETTAGDGSLDYQTDALMTLYAIFDHTEDKNELRRFMKVHRQEITIQNIKTQSVFGPLKLLDISARNMYVEGDNLRTGKVFPRGSSYLYVFVDLDYANTELTDILRNSGQITYKEATYDLLFDKMREYYDVKIEKPAYEDFLQAVSQGQRAVEEQYGAPGDAVSDDVKELADSITKGCRNDYEKCKALEEYLYQYNYNTNVMVPENANVLDWFLFEGKEGYCVHYATALAAMLRCEGIPSRLAEGFLVEYKDRVDSNRYSISSNSAHAWVEAYLEGVGWIRLEPTRTFAENAYSVWYTDRAVEEEDEEEDEEDEEAADLRDLFGEDEEPEKAEREEQAQDVWLLITVMCGGTAVFLSILLIAFLVYYRIRIRKSRDPDVVLPHLLSVLGKKYSPRGDDETLREYFQRLAGNEQMEEETREKLEAALAWMEAYWYGGRDMGEQELDKIKEIRDGFN